MAAWLRRKSFRVRLGALVAGAVGATVIVAALAAYIAVHHRLYDQIDSTLNRDVSALGSQGPFDPTRASALLHRYTGTQLQTVDASGDATNLNSTADVVFPTLPVDRNDMRIASKGPNASSSMRDVTYQGQRYRLLTVGAVLQNGPAQTPGALQIAVPLTDIDRTLSDLRLIFWIVTVAGVGVAVALGYLVGKATIRPVERLTAAAEHVAATQDLSATIDDQGADELARLAHSFNQMLRALAASRQQMGQLISDAGHELRTPLTSLRTNIEVLLRVRDLPESDRAELLTDVHAQLEEMTTLIADVVELGRDDELQAEPIEVRFDSLVTRAVERARRRAPSVHFELDLTPGAVRAQPTLLERAILNVLDNAAKFSPPDGTVRVWLRRHQCWTLDVLDQGPGIAPDDLPRVFDRFYRADAARALPGSGLGLAILRQVVTAHGGAVSASSPPGAGTLIHIELPTVVEQEPPELPPAPAIDGGEVFGPTAR